MKHALAFLSLAAALIFAPSLTAPAVAQPCQWNYSMQPGTPDPNQGVATATYCGNVNVAGTINIPGGINTVANIAALQNVLIAPVGTLYTVAGYNTAGDGGGGIFLAVSGSSAGDKCVNFSSVIGTVHWVRQLNGASLSVEMCGAYNNGTNATATVAAVQAAFDYVAASANPAQTILMQGASYNFGTGSGVTKAASFNCPTVRGANVALTTVTYSPASPAAAFTFLGGNGAICRGGIFGIAFTGNANTIALDVRDIGGVDGDIRVNVVRQAVLLESFATGQFSENDHIRVRVDDMANVSRCVLEYLTTSGTGSFKGSGLDVGSIITGSSGTTPIIVVDGGSQPYDVPLNLDYIGLGASNVLVQNNSANFMNTYGTLQIEMPGAGAFTLVGGTLTGFGSCCFQQALNNTNNLIYGNAVFGGVTGTRGGINVVRSWYTFREQATGRLSYLGAGTAATTTLSNTYTGNSNRIEHIILAGPYDWSGDVAVLNNSAGTCFAQQITGHLFAGTSPPTFAATGACALNITVPDAISANTVQILGSTSGFNEGDN